MEQKLISQEEILAKKAQIEDDIKNFNILLYIKGDRRFPQCSYSAQVVEILSAIGVKFEVRDCLEDLVLRQAIKEYSNWPTLPQLYINQEFIGGCDTVQELFTSGELQRLLSKEI